VTGSAGLRYVELGVRDLDRSRGFYSGVLGFPELSAADGDADPGVDDSPVAWFDAHGALLRVVPVNPAGDACGWVNDDLQAGIRHVGLKVGNVDAQIDRLEAAGVSVLSPPADVLGGVRIAFFLDPDGARLEYIEGNLDYEHVSSPVLAQQEAATQLRPEAGPRFDHVGLTVADLRGALQFYGGALGYPVIGDIRHHDDPRGFLMTYLRAGCAVLEVFSFDADTAAAPTPRPQQVGIRGLGLAVADPRGVTRLALAAGASPAPEAGLTARLLDPDGVPLTLVPPPPASSTALR